MRRMSTCELRELEVINVCTGEKLGYPTDFEFDVDCGQILALVVPVCDGFWMFGKRQDITIPWCKIECIGEDTILVRLSGSETECCDQQRKDKKKNK